MEGPDGKPKKINLSHDEPINEQLADVHVKHAGRIISEKLRTLKAAFDERHDKRTVAEYKAFVQMMPQLNKERDILTAHSEMCSKVYLSRIMTNNVKNLGHCVIRRFAIRSSAFD